ncbi:MAG: hypothetical protein GWN03_06415, partial [Gammaproteobacteria bacterium]|nr:hypothetical protein [Gammaproteobacteria bacterium]
MANIGSFIARSFDQDPIENGAAGCIQRLDPVSRLDVDFDRLVLLTFAVDECGLSNSRRALLIEPVGQTPALKQKHSRPHQGMGGQRIR